MLAQLHSSDLNETLLQPILEEEALSRDAFDFDPDSMPHIIDDDHLTSEKASNNNATTEHAAQPFMLGDYSEKGHFLPSASVVRNEMLEGVPLGDVDGGKASSYGRTTDGIAFRCVHCKHARDRAEMAIIRPQNLKSIRESFVHFEQTHVHRCHFIPSDIHKCYLDFKSREVYQMAIGSMAVDDRDSVWVSSAIRRGLRDAKHGGILHCPELAAKELVGPVRETKPRGQLKVKPISQAEYLRHRQLYREEEPHHNDVIAGRGGLNKHQGNIYWRKIMREVMSDYVGTRAIGKEGKRKKSVITRLVVEAVRNQSPPGRFLIQDKDTGIWNEIGDKEAMKKTKQALRDMIKSKHVANDGAANATTAPLVREKQEIKKSIKKVKHHMLNVTQEKSEISTNKVKQEVKIDREKLTLCVPATTQAKSEISTIQVKPEIKRGTKRVERDVFSAPHSCLTSAGDTLRALNHPTNVSMPSLGATVRSLTHPTNASPTSVNQILNGEGWEITKLFREEIGEWIDNEPSGPPPTKKQKLERKVSFSPQKTAKEPICLPPTKTQELEPKILPTLEESAQADLKLLKEALSINTPNKKPAKGDPKSPFGASSGYNGVSKISKTKGHKYEARFSGHRLGTYCLKADAALAYDGFVRSSGRKRHFVKINFKAQQDYLDARASELKARGDLAVDLEITLDYISAKVNAAVSKIRHRA
mmetsp:Transcript_48398/g.102924  ORF Transcript_48398/g.102924 Transcript_48398/m.102924 type:complete len:702 (+) Transcript_48398:74-2179(+)|eukprot:CAMPEP_0172551212 /NCGR_PEP_ID=MMETSP1067-20121228/36688_1 /TAXON_ID=265564 ORGANISM="Thalassiosira punctigera, Strain Tpunct2005C2" /NCGR_SAMPLE_ID=MMETSP1067 /ASSEMBLY_ACC=CAM_ASM_000444 /LENGTH=701 /DNA_ID=CAMNT_0013338969 /DNA_START=27 /DNA_END=2132 /DNA_ORIENTATION=-